jgi:hypothetical protein
MWGISPSGKMPHSNVRFLLKEPVTNSPLQMYAFLPKQPNISGRKHKGFGWFCQGVRKEFYVFYQREHFFYQKGLDETDPGNWGCGPGAELGPIYNMYAHTHARARDGIKRIPGRGRAVREE